MTTIHTPSDYHEVLTTQVGTYTVIGYLAHDNDCPHPLEDCDGMGYVVGRGKYETRSHDESELFKALGLDQYGGRDVSHAAVEARVQAQYKAWVDSLTAESVASLVPRGYDPIAFLVALANQTMDPDYEAADYLVDAGRDTFDYPDYLAWRDIYDGTWDEVAAGLPDLGLDWDKAWEEAWEAGEIGDPDAVLLDVYDHSGLAWSISGDGMQCRWDTSSGAGVWLPDAAARDEIQRRARVYDHAYISRRRGAKFALHNRQGHTLATGDDWGALWTWATEIADRCEAAGIAGTGRGRAIAAEELAEQALDSYNAWLSGDCWGTCVETYDENDELVEDDACWGFVGGDWAQEELKSQFDWQVEHLTKRVEREQRAARAANRFRDAMENAL